MKNKIAIASAFLAASSFSMGEIVVNDFLSFEGFIDASYSHTDLDGEGTFGDGNENSFAIDQVEIAWLFDFDTVTAQIDFDYEDNGADTVEVEQAFAVYHYGDGGAITAGRYASMLGFEAFEPTGLYQFSTAYDIDGLGDVSTIPFYSQGVKYTHESDTTFFGISLQDEAFDNGEGQLGGNNDESTFAIEAAGSIDVGNGLGLFLGGVYEEGDDGDAYLINAYATFETGAWIFAAEVNYGEFDRGFAAANAAQDAADDLALGALGLDDEEVIQALLMANFAYSEQASVTGRISYTDHDADSSIAGSGLEADFLKLTLAHGYAFTDNLFLVTELSYIDGDLDVDAFGLGDNEVETLEAAVELIFSF